VVARLRRYLCVRPSSQIAVRLQVEPPVSMPGGRRGKRGPLAELVMEPSFEVEVAGGAPDAPSATAAEVTPS